MAVKRTKRSSAFTPTLICNTKARPTLTPPSKMAINSKLGIDATKNSAAKASNAATHRWMKR
jgi:hypothetical protein